MKATKVQRTPSLSEFRIRYANKCNDIKLKNKPNSTFDSISTTQHNTPHEYVYKPSKYHTSQPANLPTCRFVVLFHFINYQFTLQCIDIYNCARTLFKRTKERKKSIYMQFYRLSLYVAGSMNENVICSQIPVCFLYYLRNRLLIYLINIWRKLILYVFAGDYEIFLSYRC